MQNGKINALKHTKRLPTLVNTDFSALSIERFRYCAVFFDPTNLLKI